MNATRRQAILEAYAGHTRRFDKIASRRPAASCADFGFHAAEEPAAEEEPLSERQLEVLTLVADGLSNQEICVRLDVTLETVKTHVIHILHRLGARTRAHAVGIGYKHGLLA
jgi:ATP/maltotriose-dependent transcriptional regulator MalT